MSVVKQETSIGYAPLFITRELFNVFIVSFRNKEKIYIYNRRLHTLIGAKGFNYDSVTTNKGL